MKRRLTQIFIALMIGVLIALQIVQAGAVTSRDFKDIEGNWAEPQIADLINLGIIEGYEDNTIRPDNLITRAEFSEMLAKAMAVPINDKATSIYFMDVKPGVWYYGSITALKQRGIIDGYDDRTFKPERNISRAEMISMLVRISRSSLILDGNAKVYRDLPLTHWAYWNVGIATRAGMVAGNSNYLKPDESVARAEVAYSMDKMLWNQKAGTSASEQELLDLVKNYDNTLNGKYNATSTDVKDLSAMSYGGQLDSLNAFSKNMNTYKKDGVSFNRTMNLSNPTVLFSNNLARVSFNYNLSGNITEDGKSNPITQSGLLSYLLKRVDDKWLVYSQSGDAYTELEPPKELGKLSLVWDYVGSPKTNAFQYGTIDGLDIISPTWFNVAAADGSVESRANLDYVQWAHDNGYHVWAMVTNKFDPELSSQVLNNPVARKRLINNLMANVDKYSLDGLNIDFENMYTADRDIFTKFVEEVSVPLKARGGILSVDVTIKVANSDWSGCYDRAALAYVADYVAVMTYDQHWSTSPVAGSVAQITWVENGVKGMLEEVPKEKLLLGLPFYTREWKETPMPDGTVAVSSEAISMSVAKSRIASSRAKMVWDEESGQYYAQYAKNGSTYKIWLEDERSIDLKSQLVNKYGLAGVASWKAGLETDSVWAVLRKNLNKG